MPKVPQPSNSERIIRRDRKVISPSDTRTNYPLVIEKDELERGLEIFAGALR